MIPVKASCLKSLSARGPVRIQDKTSRYSVVGVCRQGGAWRLSFLFYEDRQTDYQAGKQAFMRFPRLARIDSHGKTGPIQEFNSGPMR